MTPENLKRDAYEAYQSKQGWAESDLTDRCSDGAPRAGEYRHQRLQDDWEIWQAARGSEVTLEQAKSIVDNRSNGALEGTSPGKGGRAWLAGEWQLAELEALCVMLRHEAGDAAEGAVELLKIQADL
jgi:hypothetical protein